MFPIRTNLPRARTERVSPEWIPDPSIDPRLLPSSLVSWDNSRRVRHYKTALSKAMSCCLTPKQRSQIEMHYHLGLRKNQIAQLQQCSCSAVSKSIRRSIDALREYIELYMDIVDDVEQEINRDEEISVSGGRM